MELTFTDLRNKEVINTKDGRKLGKVCDVLLRYPENRWLGVVVPGENGFFRKKNELFIDLKNIVTIGEDVILVNVGLPCNEKHCGKTAYRTPCSPRPQDYYGNNRNYEETE